VSERAYCGGCGRHLVELESPCRKCGWIAPMPEDVAGGLQVSHNPEECLTCKARRAVGGEPKPVTKEEAKMAWGVFYDDVRRNDDANEAMRSALEDFLKRRATSD
jgi:hypothetical protein